MELLPAVFPTWKDSLRPNGGERGAHGDLASVVGEHRELRRAVERTLLQPGGKAVEQPRCSDLDLAVRHPQRDAAEPGQRSALFSRRKKPSSSSGLAA